jgi:hypothetical protein
MAVWGSKVFLPAIKMDGRRLRVIVHNVAWINYFNGVFCLIPIPDWRYADKARIQLALIFPNGIRIANNLIEVRT